MILVNQSDVFEFRFIQYNTELRQIQLGYALIACQNFGEIRHT